MEPHGDRQNSTPLSTLCGCRSRNSPAPSSSGHNLFQMLLTLKPWLFLPEFPQPSTLNTSLYLKQGSFPAPAKTGSENRLNDQQGGGGAERIPGAGKPGRAERGWSSSLAAAQRWDKGTTRRPAPAWHQAPSTLPARIAGRT